MMAGVILWGSILWLAPILYAVLRNETKFKKNLAVGVTFPYQARQDPQVTDRLRRFHRQLGWICGGLFALGIPCMFIRRFSLSFCLWGVWLILCLVLPYVAYGLCNRDLRRVKAERGWRQGEENVVAVELSAIPPARPVSPWGFLPGLVLSLLPLLLDRSMAVLYLTNGACCLIFWLSCRYLYRNRSERVDGDLTLTQVLTRIRRQNWERLWPQCAWATGLLSAGLFLASGRPGWVLALYGVYTAALLFAVLRVEFRTRRRQEELTAGCGQGAYVDEDDRWLWGIFYYNPRDTRVLINDRVGIGTSLNLARPAGKIVMGLSALLILAFPFVGPALEAAADRPISLTLEDGLLEASHGSTQYALAVEEVDRVELLEDLPDGLTRTAGTGMENLLTGNFSAPGIGSLRVCLDPTCPPFLLVTGRDGRNLLLGCRDAAATEDVWSRLLAETGAGG